MKLTVMFLSLVLLLTPTKTATSSYVHIDKNELDCLTKVVYHEARGEPKLGQIGVAFVVLNRVNSNNFPKKICEVVYQPKQFSNIENCLVKDVPSWYRAKQVAMSVYLGKLDDPTHGATHYFNPHKIIPPKWANKLEYVKTIFNHKFYKE